MPNDSNGANDVFLRDTTAGTTALVSVNAAGTDSAAGNSANVSITPAGTGVVFTSTAGDLGPADTNGLDDVYVWPARLPSPVQFSSPHFGVVENSGPALVTLTRTGDVQDGASVDLTTTNGTATAPGDYTDADARVTFAPGETIATVTIPVTNDPTTEGEETVLLSLSNPGDGTALGTTVTATLTIFDPADDGVSEVADQDGTVTTDEGDDGATPADPIETAITSPNPGAVTIVENNEPTANPPADYELLETEVRITAPPATPGDPLRLEFRLDAALVGDIAAADIAVVRNGVVAAECPGDTDAVPYDPCVTSRITEPAPDGDVVIVVLTSAASTWNFAVAADGTEGDLFLSIGGSEKLPAVGGGRISVQNEDVVLYDASEDAYQLVFDGSDVGLANAEIDALAVLGEGDLVLSFQADEKVPGVGKVDDSDLVRFTGDLGSDTDGTFSVYLDGSDIGLDHADEDVDAIEVRDGDIYLSTTGAFSPGVGRTGHRATTRTSSSAARPTPAASPRAAVSRSSSTAAVPGSPKAARTSTLSVSPATAPCSPPRGHSPCWVLPAPTTTSSPATSSRTAKTPPSVPSSKATNAAPAGTSSPSRWSWSPRRVDATAEDAGKGRVVHRPFPIRTTRLAHGTRTAQGPPVGSPCVASVS